MSKPKVLFIDDEVSILSALKRSLRNQFIDVSTTDSYLEALELVKQNDFSVVISDQRMPGMDGSELLEKIKELSPDSIRILLTGFADIHAAVEAINRGFIYKFIAKPWDDQNLFEVVQDAVERYELISENRRLQAMTKQLNQSLLGFNQTLEQRVVEETVAVARLGEELKQSLLGMVQVMAKMAESHSFLVGSHSKRVLKLCQMIGKDLGLTEEELYHLIIASSLHDIGKVCIDAFVLEKQEKMLTDNEKDTIKKHVIHGESMLLMIPHMAPIAKIVRHHHERFNGTGYPDKLSGKDIPLASRIIAVVDAYDNALNKRTSFESTTPEKSLNFVKNLSGSHFDPAVVELLARHVRDGSTNDELELEVNTQDLKAGMVLSRDLVTVRGQLLLKKGNALQKNNLSQLINFLQANPPADGIYVYRQDASRA